MTEKDPAKSIQQAYRQTFKGEVPKEVLADLRIYCHATKTTAGRTESIERLEGRREVFLRIMTYLKVDIEDVYDYELDF
jgi:hypothetical protein